MIKTVEKYLKEKNIIQKRVIVAVSGGPDSITLLDILNKLKIKYNLELIAAYVNHGIRAEDENLKDLHLISSLCNSLKIPLEIKNIDKDFIKNISIKNKSSIEVEARNIRYDFFNSLADENSLIAVGHNRDDQIETQIMRIFQGSSIDGLLGIKSENNNIIRPLLGIDKIEIISYLNSNNIQYLIDHTNNEVDYLRNKVRNLLIPTISDIFPGYKKSLNEFEKSLKEIKAEINSYNVNIIWEKSENSYSLLYEKFINLSVYDRKQSIFKLFNETYSGDIKGYRLPKRFLIPLEKSKFKNNEIILDGHGFRLVREGHNVTWKSSVGFS